jgi:hypothetical protein
VWICPPLKICCGPNLYERRRSHGHHKDDIDEAALLSREERDHDNDNTS